MPRKRKTNEDNDRRPVDGKRNPRVKARDLDRKVQRNVKRTLQGR